MSAESEIQCPGCGAKVKIGNGHSSSCPNCNGKVIRYRRGNRTKKLTYHPPGYKLIRTD